MRVNVLNAEGRDPLVDYASGPGLPDPRVHPPVNYWAYAAATGGRFCQHLDEVTPDAGIVVVLLRRRNRDALHAVRQLKRDGRRVYVSWKETGAHQIEQQLRWFWERPRLRTIFGLADGAIATTRASEAHYRRFGGAGYPVLFMPTPYPVDEPGWDFSVPVQERKGIFIGTREFDVPSRRHAEALRMAAAVAAQAGCRVTVINTQGTGAKRKIMALLGGGAAEINIVERKLHYPDYLRLMATHRIVLQRDISHVPGQVAGDALLCRLINVGGNGTIQEIAFPEYTSGALDESALMQAATRLLSDDQAYLGAVEKSQARARELLSFQANRQQWDALVSQPEMAPVLPAPSPRQR